MLAKSLVILTLATLSFARALPLAKRDGPTHWWSGLEDYDTYHNRYLALDCEEHHKSSFFTACCHPRLKDADLSTIPEECRTSDDDCDDNGDDNTPPAAPMNVEPSPPASTPSSTSQAAATHTSTPKGGNNGNNGNNNGNGNGGNDNGNGGNDNGNGGNDNGGGNGNVIKGSGEGTYYLQNGNAGACGTVHPDSAKIVALDIDLYGDDSKASQYCGKSITITNTNNGKSVQAIVADACPTCGKWGNVDMSVGAFTEIATEEEGEVPISWELST